MKKLLFPLSVAILLMLFLSVSLQMKAQSASFSNLRLEYNSPDEHGRQMLKMHFSMAVIGAQGHEVCAALCIFRDKNGSKHFYANGNQMKADSGHLKCSWETTYTSGDWWVGIYNDQLNALPGRHTYYCQQWAYDFTTQQWIGQSDFLSYDITGNQPVPQVGGYNSPGFPVYGGGSYQNPAPSSQQRDNNRTSNQKTCSKCGGSGNCTTCHGRGNYIPRIGDPYKTCVVCNGSGRCTLCNGTGKYGHSY